MGGQGRGRGASAPYAALEDGDRPARRRCGRALAAAAALLVLGGAGLLLLLLAAPAPPPPPPPPLLVCYYAADGALSPAQLAAPARLCSHINVAFASVRDKRLALTPALAQAVAGAVALRAARPALRVLLSVGGAGGDAGFPDMVADHASRKTFIRSLRGVLRDHALDGVDLDWEFPGVRGGRGGPRNATPTAAAARERQHFSQLLREIRAEFSRERRPYLLTVAAAAPDPIADAAYDVDQLDLHADWVNVMAYDFHYYSEYTPFTGHNAPLRARADEHLYLATLNAEHAARAYLRRGLRPSRLALGVPAFGHSFALVSAAGAAVGSPARGVGALGAGGFVSRHDVCAFLRAHRDAALQRDPEARVPFAARAAEWVSFEDERSAREKAALVRALRLAGAMLYSLNADDPRGQCGLGAFPITHALRAALDSH